MGTHTVRPLNRSMAALAAVVVCVCSIAFYRAAYAPLTGDEPHYLVYATSLARGWGLDLRRAYAIENRQAFYDGALEPHAAFYAGRDGRFASWHAIGLPLLLAPMAAIAPPPQAYRWLMLATTALLAYHLVLLTQTLTGSRSWIVFAGAAAVLATPPILFFSAQVYPELIAAVLVVLACRALAGQRGLRTRLNLASLAAVLLPWLNLRYASLTAALGIIIAVCGIVQSEGTGVRRASSIARSLTVPMMLAVSSAAGLLAFNRMLFAAPVAPVYFSGFFEQDIYLYGAGPLIGFPSGVLAFGPILAVAAVAVLRASRVIGTGRTVAGTAVVLAYLAVNAYFGSPGHSLPGRYQVTVLPLLAVPLTAALMLGGLRAWAIMMTALALSVMTAVGSARHFQDLYTTQRMHIAPIGKTERLWPIAVAEVLPDALSGTAHDVQHEVGQIEEVDGERCMIARPGRDVPGVVAYVPHVRLQNGRYRAIFNLYVHASPGQWPPARIRVFDGEGVVLQEGLVPAPDESRFTQQSLDFDVTHTASIGLHVLYAGGAPIGVRSASVVQLAPAAARRIEAERWKALVWALGLLTASIIWWRAPVRGRRPSPAAV